MMIDLKSMSRKELLKLKSDVKKALRDAEVKARREAREAAERAVAEYGFSLSEISADGALAKRKKPSAPAKYRNPENPAQTWSGRGRRPGWMNDAVAAGIDPATMEI
jgi:DNA-binding protein H-NS